MAISTKSNMRVHYRRNHPNVHFTERKFEEMDWVTVHKSQLMRGRFYGRILDDSDTDTSSISDHDDVAPAIATVDPVDETDSDDEVIGRRSAHRSVPAFLVSSDEELENVEAIEATIETNDDDIVDYGPPLSPPSSDDEASVVIPVAHGIPGEILVQVFTVSSQNDDEDTNEVKNEVRPETPPVEEEEEDEENEEVEEDEENEEIEEDAMNPMDLLELTYGGLFK